MKKIRTPYFNCNCVKQKMFQAQHVLCPKYAQQSKRILKPKILVIKQVSYFILKQHLYQLCKHKTCYLAETQCILLCMCLRLSLNLLYQKRKQTQCRANGRVCVRAPTHSKNAHTRLSAVVVVVAQEIMKMRVGRGFKLLYLLISTIDTIQ